MPYRGTNAKRNVVHDKSRGTIREQARAHFLNEQKEHEHELSEARTRIQKLLNDGYVFNRKSEKRNSIYIYFEKTNREREVIELKFPDNANKLEEFLN
ncbi:hypothetical protein [Fusibacter tunisiensis]|uniref:Uncharacterized protein n=1 Tax=Fusibacter tunisiensis TaxID=1008308 RepID=A0ABS2MT30_9FIRM|nr:hypothetical protein [Fusibacter tunisiensis]MBM7562588.1 hypothetical protein [Fusibacter tunisiensis]